MADQPPAQRLALILDNLAETLNPEIIEKILAEGRNPKIYWGTAVTGRPHCGYFVPAIKIGQMLAAGCDMTILLADIHGFLDNLKAPLDLVAHRVGYYRHVIAAILHAVGVPTERLRFVQGSSYQQSPDYVLDVYKLASLVSEHDAKKAGAEVVKQTDNAPLSSLLYPILQVLDEHHLDVDAQFGGVDQRKLFTAAKDWLPKLGYRQRAHLMNPMIPGLKGAKMSSSDEDSKIDLLDPPDVVTKKIRKAFAAPKVVEGNGLLAFVEYVLLPAAALRDTRQFLVDRDQDGLPALVYHSVQQMHDDYQNDVLSPQLLKAAVAKALNRLLAPIQAAFQASPEWQAIALKAYPFPPKKETKTKDKGTRHPGHKLGADHPSTLTSMANLASTYRNQGRWEEAEKLEVQVMETRKTKLGADHPDTLTIMNNLAFTWRSQGRYTDALALMKQCAQAFQRILGPEHPDTLSSMATIDEWA